MNPPRTMTTMKASRGGTPVASTPTDDTDMGKVAQTADVASMNITPAENGFSVEHRFHPKKRASRGGMEGGMEYKEPETHVFSSHHDVAEHVRKTFGGGKAKKEAA